ncbi:MAG: preprotein translocase subunit SecG [Spirochaetaceae bacterium]|nr:preprotein translocase subunit SecG [Spirochaetaceae bacterium]
MGVIGIVLLVAFVFICILLVCVVLLQNEEGGGMGGLLGGGNSTAFGSRSGNVLTKTTYILVTLFFVATFALAFINKAPAVHSLDAAAAQEEATETGGFWLDEESSPEATSTSETTSTAETGSTTEAAQ